MKQNPPVGGSEADGRVHEGLGAFLCNATRVVSINVGSVALIRLTEENSIIDQTNDFSDDSK